jgi:hypothetical protein
MIVLPNRTLEVPEALRKEDISQSSQCVSWESLIDWIDPAQSEEPSAVLRPHGAEVDQHHERIDQNHTLEGVLQLQKLSNLNRNQKGSNCICPVVK